MALNLKQTVFIDAYLGSANGNATEAARQAGYKDAKKEGYRHIRHPEIAAAIKERLTESAMPAEEVLSRLTEHARAGYAAFISSSGDVDLHGLERAGLMRLVKKISWDKAGNRVVEFHDVQTALVQLGKHYGQFTERHEHMILKKVAGEVESMSDDELAAFLAGNGDPATTRTA